ncbi:MAG: hypothetical protein AAGJ18_19565 [Bacteroidota bacterium]
MITTQLLTTQLIYMSLNQLFLGIFLLLLVACGSDNNTTQQKEMLIGRWDLVEGRRSGKVAESLRGTYFEFTADDKMSTNLPIKGATNSPYVIEDGVIFQTIINGLKIDYTIVQLTDKTLQLTTKLRGLDFVFDLTKVEMEENMSMN